MILYRAPNDLLMLAAHDVLAISSKGSYSVISDYEFSILYQCYRPIEKKLPDMALSGSKLRHVYVQ